MFSLAFVSLLVHLLTGLYAKARTQQFFSTKFGGHWKSGIRAVEEIARFWW